MKTKTILIPLTIIFFALLQGCYSGYVSSNGSTSTDYSIQNNNNNTNQDNSLYQDYNADELNQYGDWDNTNDYGRVWHPSVNPGWQPFVNGHWAYDGYDWVWISYEPFGWMVYHYGSWEFTAEYGWVWVPARDPWSPACVQWIYYDDQVGWAPRRSHSRNWNEPWEQNQYHPWVVVHMEDFNRENVVKYRLNDVPRVGNDQTARIERRQPDVKIVQERVREPIQTVKYIEREPVNRTPVRDDVSNPTGRTPVKTDVTPPIERTPVKTDVTPPTGRTPVKTDVTPTGRTPQNSGPIYRMQIPKQEKQKVDRYQPAVEKDVLRKKAPVSNDNRDKPNNTEDKQKSGSERK